MGVRKSLFRRNQEEAHLEPDVDVAQVTDKWKCEPDVDVAGATDDWKCNQVDIALSLPEDDVSVHHKWRKLFQLTSGEYQASLLCCKNWLKLPFSYLMAMHM